MTLELLRSIVGIPLQQYLYQRPIRALTIENGSSMDNCLRACSMACKENASCVCPVSFSTTSRVGGHRVKIEQSKPKLFTQTCTQLEVAASRVDIKGDKLCL